MTKNKKTVQLTLIFIGLILILATYYIYPEISKNKFIEQKLKEGGISLQEQSKVHVNVNPSADHIIKEGEKALLIPWGNYEKWTIKKL